MTAWSAWRLRRQEQLGLASSYLESLTFTWKTITSFSGSGQKYETATATEIFKKQFLLLFNVLINPGKQITLSLKKKSISKKMLKLNYITYFWVGAFWPVPVQAVLCHSGANLLPILAPALTKKAGAFGSGYDTLNYMVEYVFSSLLSQLEIFDLFLTCKVGVGFCQGILHI